MAGEYLQAGRYRVRTVVYKRNAVESNGAINGYRVGAIYQDPPSFTASRFHVKAVVASQRAYDANGAISSARLGVIIRSPNGSINSARMGFIIEQSEFGPPARATSSFQMVMQDSAFLPPEMTFSKESAAQVWETALHGVNVVPPDSLWSDTKTSSATFHALVGLNTTPVQSWTRSPSVAETALIPALYGQQSTEYALSAAEMVLVSLVNSTPAVSMDYAKAVVEMALSSWPTSGMPTTPASVATLAEKVLRKRPLVFPQSDITVAQYAEKVLRMNTLPLAQSSEDAAQTVEVALIGQETLPLPQSPVHVSTETEVALIGTSMPNPFGPVNAGSVAETTLIASDVGVPVGSVEFGSAAEMVLKNAEVDEVHSHDIGASVSSMVVLASPMPTPGDMSGALVGNYFEKVVSDLPVPGISEIRSTTKLAQTGLKWLLGADYPTPGEMIPLARAAQSVQLGHTTLQRNVQPMPWSKTKVGSLSIETLLASVYDSPEAVLTNGAFMSLIAGQAMAVADYPPTATPGSTVGVDIVAGTTLCAADDYPDKSYSVSDAKVALVGAQALISEDGYPSKDLVQSNAIFGMIAQYLLSSDKSFPDKDLAQSEADLQIIGQQALTTASDYPDKDMVQSTLSTGIVAEVAATRAADYPDKDSPQSEVEVSICVEQVIATDESMYEMPAYSGRNKPMVFTTIVY